MRQKLGEIQHLVALMSLRDCVVRPDGRSYTVPVVTPADYRRMAAACRHELGKLEKLENQLRGEGKP